MARQPKPQARRYAGRIARAQGHFRTLRLATPFQPRIDALMKTEDWYNWAGYQRAAFAVGRGARIFRHPQPGGAVRHLADGQIPHRRPGRRGLPQPRHPARRREAEARPRPLHRLVRRRRPCARRRHAVPAVGERASGCAARSGICRGCSTAPSASTSTVDGGDRGRRRPGAAGADLLRRAARRRLCRRREAEGVRPRRFSASRAAR